MRAKTMLVVMCVIGLSFITLTGCSNSKEENVETIELPSLEENLESARQLGYNQAYLEIVYGTSFRVGISEESYNEYVKARDEYEKDMTVEHFNALALATQNALKELQ